ncbi:MAG: ABC transporter substrate-binding protein [Methanospirillum sp.]|nr:ABC transporter substrate-binding protein [Methanospirillum sp.]
MQKRVIFSIFLLTLLFLSNTPAIADARGVTLDIAAPWDAKTSDPHVNGAIAQRMGVIETLVDINDEALISPGLATSWEVSGDQKTWTFHLRDGVKYHDGTPFTAQTMKRSLEDSLKKSKTFSSVPIQEIKAVDDQTLEIVLTQQFPSLPAYMAKGESAALSEASIDEGDISMPYSTGPFKFSSYTPNDEYVAVKNAEYWGKVSSADEVIYHVVPEAETRSMMLKGGDVQIAQILSPDITEGYATDSSYTVNTEPISRVRLISYNCESGPFADTRVRQAMNYAINRQDLVDYVLEGVGEPATSLFPPEFYWGNKNIQQFPYDPEKAKAMLAEAGWTDSNNDGILEKDGEKFSVTLVTYPERAELPQMAEIIQDELKDIGVDVEVKSVDIDTSENLKNSGDFDMYLGGRSLMNAPDPDWILMADYHSSGSFNNGYGPYHWKNAKLDSLLEEARTLTGNEARKKLYDQAQEIINDEAPVSVLSYYVNQDVTSDKVKGYRMHPTEFAFHLEDVSLS